MHSSFSVSGISRDEAYRLIRASGSDLTALLREASCIRDARTGRVITYSRKVFIPLTNLCRAGALTAPSRANPAIRWRIP
jgi:2-iminoacetate synthase ThiH